MAKLGNKKSKKYSDNDIWAIYEMYFNRNMSTRQVARRTGMSAGYVSMIVSGKNYADLHREWMFKYPESAIKRNRKITKDEVMRILELWNEKQFSQHEIAASFSISRSHVKTIVNGYQHSDWYDEYHGIVKGIDDRIAAADNVIDYKEFRRMKKAGEIKYVDGYWRLVGS